MRIKAAYYEFAARLSVYVCASGCAKGLLESNIHGLQGTHL